MNFWTRIKIDVLRALVDAEQSGKPLTYEATQPLRKGTTWEDLETDGMIEIKPPRIWRVPLETPQPNVYVASEKGKQWLTEQPHKAAA